MLYTTPYGKYYSTQAPDESGYPPDVQDFIRTEALRHALKQAMPQVQAEYDRRCVQPVEHDGKSFKGGFQSALAINAVADLAEASGHDTATIYDIDSDAHELTIGQAKALVAAIGTVYQAHFAAKKAVDKALNNAHDADEVALIAAEYTGMESSQ